MCNKRDKCEEYLIDCYHAGQYIKPDVVQAVWYPYRCGKGVFCSRCDISMDDYNGQPDKCLNCGVRLEGWIDIRDLKKEKKNENN